MQVKTTQIYTEQSNTHNNSIQYKTKQRKSIHIIPIRINAPIHNSKQIQNNTFHLKQYNTIQLKPIQLLQKQNNTKINTHQ